jgi:hypothetical protein
MVYTVCGVRGEESNGLYCVVCLVRIALVYTVCGEG